MTNKVYKQFACESQSLLAKLIVIACRAFPGAHVYTLCCSRSLTMSQLRRRLYGSGGGADSDSTPSSSRDASPAPGHQRRDESEYKVIPRQKLERLKSDVKIAKRKGRKRRSAWIFGLGGVFGIFIAGFFASSNGGLDTLVEFAGMKDMNLDSILDILPAGIIKDVQNLQVRSALVYVSFSS